MKIIADLPLLETLLDAHSEAIGLDFIAYRNHCCRVVNLCVALSGAESEAAGKEILEKAQIAAAFHDIAIWTHRNFDYLEPSAELARQYLKQSGRGAWSEEISAMVTEHHRVRHARGTALVEAFRRADWCDVLLGARRFGLPSEFVRNVKREFPNRGFHKRLVELSTQQFIDHPFNPLPMFKW